VIELDIEYSNIPAGEATPRFDHKEVRATVTVNADRTQWGGLAVKAPIYEQVPTGAAARQTYKRTLRYSQGILFKFKGKGKVYRIDYFRLITALTSTLVLLRFAHTVTAFVAQFLWPTKTMIMNKTREKFAIGTRLVEIGMKAVSYGAIFNDIDQDSDGALSAADLKATLKRTKYPFKETEIDAIVALLIRRLGGLNSVGEGGSDNADTMLNLDEFMHGLEGGTMINMDQFRKQVVSFAEKKKGSGYLTNKRGNAASDNASVEV